MGGHGTTAVEAPEGAAPRLCWLGPSPFTADELLAAEGNTPPQALGTEPVTSWPASWQTHHEPRARSGRPPGSKAWPSEPCTAPGSNSACASNASSWEPH